MSAAIIRFGRYELTERLAVGGMAELYRAVLTGPSGFQKTVAIKKILPDLGNDPAFREMFLHEGRIMAALAHRNLVEVYELGEVDGELYISLELVTGCDLADLTSANARTGSFVEPVMAAHIAREICRGLEYVHGLTDEEGRPQHVVHRDVSPQNVLLSDHGDVKLGDFGIAKSVVRADGSARSQTHGKPEYLSPEQARGDEEGPASDLYAVGLLLFEMLTSERYIRGADTAELIARAARPAWRSIREINPAVPVELEKIVQRALRAEPEARYPSAIVLSEALEPILREAARPPTPDEVAHLVARVKSSRLPGPGTAGKKPIPTPACATPGRSVPPLDDRSPIDLDRPMTLALSARDKQRARSRRSLPILGGLGILAVVAVGLSLLTRPEPIAPSDARPVARTMPPEPKPQPLDAGVAEPGDPAAAPDAGGSASVAPATPDSPTPRRAKKKRSRRKRRLPPRRKVAAKQPEPVTPPPPVVSPATTGDSRDELNDLGQELVTQLRKMRRRGIRPGDDMRIDSLINVVKTAIAARDAGPARARLDQLEQAIDKRSIDRAFVEEKMQRLEAILAKKNVKSEFSPETQEVLDHVLNSRFHQANQVLNRIFDRVE